MPTIKKAQRILALDILRGYFLLVIAIDHFQHFPSLFDPLTGRGRLWVSAAEGFFIISGLVVGYIYGPKMLKSTKQAIVKIWKRALLLFVLCAVFTLFFTAWGMLFRNFEGLRPGLLVDATFAETAYKAFTLQYIYGWVDFLALYAVFMFFAPLAVYLTIKSKGWLVVLVSVLLWALLRGYDIRFGWQALFMPAVVLGYYLPSIDAKIADLGAPLKKRLYGTLAAITLCMLLVSIYFVFAVPFAINRPALVAELPVLLQTIIAESARVYSTSVEPLFYKWTLPLGRVLFAWVWFATLYVLVRHFEKPIEKYTRGVLSLLGKNSLFTYCLMGVLIFGLHFIFPPQQKFFSADQIVGNTILIALLIGLIYAIVRYRSALLIKKKPSQ